MVTESPLKLKSEDELRDIFLRHLESEKIKHTHNNSYSHYDVEEKYINIYIQCPNCGDSIKVRFQDNPPLNCYSCHTFWTEDDIGKYVPIRFSRGVLYDHKK